MAVAEACELINQGKSASDIKEYLEKTKSDSGIYLAVDTLKYLKKGGRVTPAAAAIGTLLSIKPILKVAGGGGKLDAYAKVISMKQAKAKIINAVKKEIEEKYPEELKNGQVYIAMAHSMPDVNAKELLDFKQEVIDAFPECKLYCCDPLPLFVACHTGPSSLAAGYIVDRLGIIKNY